MHYRAILLFLMGSFVSSCTDLEVFPQDRADPNAVFTEEENYEAFLARIYAGLALTGQQGPSGQPDLSSLDEGFSSYLRQYWQLQELPTESAVIQWGDAGLPELIFQTWTPNNQFIRAMYYRVFFQVSLANEFLRETTTDRLQQRGIREDFWPTVEQYRAEARFLRALSYWHGIDMFGDIIFYTEESSLGGDVPAEGTRGEIFEFLVRELDAIEDQLPDMGAAEYGRVDKGALYMLQAKLFQNAEVYTGQERHADAVAALENIVGSDAYSLEENYADLFKADNHTSDELIFAIPFDGETMQTYGGLTYLTHAPIGGAMDPADYGIDGGWSGLRATRALVNLFPDVTGETDERAIFFTEGQTLEINNISEFSQGYTVPKYTNVTSEGIPGSDPRFADTDFPLFRLGDAYLMYAESAVRSGSGNLDRAVELVNELRERAYNSDAGNITADDLTLEFLLDERGRELYWEAHRRTDRIRFDAFTVNGVWPWKGGVPEGRTTEAYLNVFPIPASEILSNPNLSQNTGY
ncbi:putative outer membrane starch-binding protein [Neolewinella xylanilytica]|uniref:Putative outer membrane starch-binding protein n=1 Tax=Neolewinella xylanilytica TaxID=1514080 RepID=A0A2S6I776_9BACT|nr:RagB/SusD family nutrient uptake outer membrane protein [Neolewinella xylanilytica]PPK87317.1 putative outer membrane starch-binding protein [Neolewinella xylanilytica]